MFSMTGYGKGSASTDGREMTVELKSVNHRYLDVGMRLPRHLSFLEDPIRSALTGRLSRGHVDVFVNYRNLRSDARSVEIDAPLLAAFVAAARQSNETLGLQDDLSLTAALRLPDVSSVRETDEDPDALLGLLNVAINGAIDAMLVMRKQEGDRLSVYLGNCADTIESLTNQIAVRAPVVVEEYRVKLNNATASLVDTFTSADVDWAGRPLQGVTADTFDRQFGVDARAGALLIAEFARRLQRRGGDWGRIISMTSGGEKGFPQEVSYGAAKAALVNYTMSASLELSAFGVTANAIHPPVTDTGWVTDDVREAVRRDPRFFSVAEPLEVADLAAFLVSRAADRVTGNVIRMG